MASEYKDCSKCSKKMNVIDDHDDCYRHRLCNSSFPCSVCKGWSEDKRRSIDSMIDKTKSKKVFSPPEIVTSSSSSTSVLPMYTAERIPTSPFTGNFCSSTSPFTGNITYSTCTMSPSTGNNIQSNISPLVKNLPSATSLPHTLPEGSDQLAMSSMWQCMMPFMSTMVQEMLDKRMNNTGQIETSSSNVATVSTTPITPPGMPGTSNTLTFPDGPLSLNNMGDMNNNSQKKRFSKFVPSNEYEDISDDESILSHKAPSQLSAQSEQVSVSESATHISQFSRVCKTVGDGSWQSFLNKVANKLDISINDDVSEQCEVKSFIPDILSKNTNSSPDVRLPLDGSVIQTFMNIDKQYQTKKEISTYKSNDDTIYKVDRQHFDSFCRTPHLDENASEGLASANYSSSFRKSKKSDKSQFVFKNRDLFSLNSEMKKVDAQARLLLRQVSYATLFTSYLEKVDNEDKTEGLRALMEVFAAMTDVISRMIINTVKSRRQAHLSEMAFKNKSTENKLLSLSTIGANLFNGKFFDILHESADNIRDAKETQFLRRTGGFEPPKKRKAEPLALNSQPDSAPGFSKKRKHSDSYKSQKKHGSKTSVSAEYGNSSQADFTPKSSDRFPKKGLGQSGFRPPK